MIIDCISDLYGHYPMLKGGDLLIVAGDLTARDSPAELAEFCEWIDSQNYKMKIVVPGNHDDQLQTYLCLEGMEEEKDEYLYGAEYLCDSGTEFEGLKIWGSPWTKRFEGMNPNAMAFTVKSENDLLEKWKNIPHDIDVLITHSPPKCHLDWVGYGELRVGSTALAGVIEKIKPRLSIFGHIHASYGRISIQKNSVNDYDIDYINASHVNEHYEPVNKPIRIEL